jgi:4-amino-4-deoxy-L-arabinose transferase-like glycosyltransferase
MRQTDLKKIFEKVPKYVWVLILIIAVGIFLRVYHFHDWLQFSPDQARDAAVVRDAIFGKTDLPLLGPIAGGTEFHLGPAFYYFGYFSSLLFGATPDAMAYPTLFFSVLSIPLLFFFLKKFFSVNLSLALAGLSSVSFFAVEYSRFAWNPNLIPFFVLIFLYSFLEIIEGNDEKNLIWPIVAGVALGIGVQLHTLLLLIMPVMVLAIAAYLFWRKKLIWKSFLVIIFLALFVNAPQIVSEVRTGGQNMRNFFSGANTQTEGGGLTIAHVGIVASCQAEYDLHMVSAFENKEECKNIFAAGKYDIKRLKDIPGNFRSHNFFVASMTLAIIFSLGGYALLILGWFSEENPQKKNFLGLIILFNFITLAFFFPVASNIFMRYYIIVFAIPFVLLGLWVEFISKKLGKTGIFLAICAVIVLMFSNWIVIRRAAAPYVNASASDGENSILGEIEPVAAYIVEKTKSDQTAYISGEKSYEERYSGSFAYLAFRSNVNIFEFDKVSQVDSSFLQFYIAETTKKKYHPGDQFKGKKIEDVHQFGKITILLLKQQ